MHFLIHETFLQPLTLRNVGNPTLQDGVGFDGSKMWPLGTGGCHPQTSWRCFAAGIKWDYLMGI